MLSRERAGAAAGGFTGFGALDTGDGSKSADQAKTGHTAEEEYSRSRAFPTSAEILGSRKRS